MAREPSRPIPVLLDQERVARRRGNGRRLDRLEAERNPPVRMGRSVPRGEGAPVQTIFHLAHMMAASTSTSLSALWAFSGGGFWNVATLYVASDFMQFTTIYINSVLS